MVVLLQYNETNNKTATSICYYWICSIQNALCGNLMFASRLNIYKLKSILICFRIIIPLVNWLIRLQRN